MCIQNLIYYVGYVQRRDGGFDLIFFFLFSLSSLIYGNFVVGLAVQSIPTVFDIHYTYLYAKLIYDVLSDENPCKHLHVGQTV